MKKLFLISFILSTLLAGMLFTGCETDSSTQKVYITPDSVSVYPGDSVQFTANGGYEYTWSLESESLGTLSARTGSTIVYTSSSSTNLSSDVTQVLTVTSTIPDEETGNVKTTDTNGVTTTTSSGAYGYEVTAHAYITHLSVTEETATLKISPATATVTSGGEVSFKASGGDGTYTWSSSAGTIASSGRNATYVASTYSNSTPANTTVSVTSGGQTAQAVVVHE